jgi:hypothetical protein
MENPDKKLIRKTCFAGLGKERVAVCFLSVKGLASPNF